ncbi:hypothetical protein W59_25245 [Rhodococcus opacus RKJ300 = JCM 13270]|uniref:Uncharacterized protein n=1 Tax=Rhodococcus opacus RKJ300 = JCM 13270 TaxID=1165867 RepID=I0WLC9_RHOOP|nr:hypothetical protein W59_25245 [Rhodococcus opacus RKJ300 = JCM 13270]
MPILAFIVVGLLVLAVAAFFVARVFALFD